MSLLQVVIIYFFKSHDDIRYLRFFYDCIFIIHESMQVVIFLKSHDDIKYLRIFYDCILIIHELVASCHLFVCKLLIIS